MVLGGILLMVIAALAIYLGTEDTWKSVVWMAIGALIGGVALCNEGFQEQHPQAIDVYRGKTTLEITYRDSVAVDSVVVYKIK